MTVSPTTTLNGTITPGKTRKLLDIDDSTAGSKSIIFTNEASAVSISVNVVSLSGTTRGYWELWAIGGDSANHQSRIYRSDLEGGIGTRRKDLFAAGKLRLDVYYIGAAEFEFSATGIDPAAVADAVSKVAVQLTDEDRAFQERQLSVLENINDKLEMILNHHRLITGVEKDKGDIF